MAVYTLEILVKKEKKIKNWEVRKINFENSWSNGGMNSHVPIVYLQEL